MIRNLVSVNLFSGLDGLELVKLDDAQAEIEKAVSIVFQGEYFDPLTRQITAEESFLDDLRALYEKARISPSTPTLLTLPSLYTRVLEVKDDAPIEAIDERILQEVERIYLFKRNEPHITWTPIDTHLYLYSAYPRVVIDGWVQAFEQLGIPLIGLDVNYLSIIRGLVATGALGDHTMEYAQNWGLFVLTESALMLGHLQGSQLLRLNEVPIALGNLSQETDLLQLMTDCKQEFSQFFAGNGIPKLVLVNNIPELVSDKLVHYLDDVEEAVVVVDQNFGTLRSRGVPDGIFPCTLEGVGGAFAHKLNTQAHLNFAPGTGMALVELEAAKTKAFKGLVVANVLAALLCGLLWGGLFIFNWMQEQQKNALGQNMPSVTGKTAFAEVKQKLFVKEARQHNIFVNNMLIKLGTLMPKDMWMEKVEIKPDTEVTASPGHGLFVKFYGGSLSAESVNRWVGDLGQATDVAWLEVDKIELTSAPLTGVNYYTWVVQTKKAKNAQASGGGR
jgi:hypothetical protein